MPKLRLYLSVQSCVLNMFSCVVLRLAAHVQETRKVALGMQTMYTLVGFFQKLAHDMLREALGIQQPPVMPQNCSALND